MRSDAQRNHERLLDAARAVFTEHGAEARLDDIARRAGVGAGTLYRHFPTREALLARVYQDELESLAARAAELADRLPPGEALAAWLRLQLDYVRDKRGLGEAVKVMLGPETETMGYCRQLMRGSIGHLLEQAKAAGEAREDVEPVDVLRLVHGVALASDSAPESGDRMLGYVIDGLRPVRPDR